MRVRFYGVVALNFLFLINSLCLFHYEAYPAEQKIVLKTEKGTQVVYNPKDPAPPPGSPSSVVLKQDLVIGLQTENEEYMFFDLRSIQVDDKENIYTLDDKEIKIKVFDNKGKLIRVFGKKGQGPGEMSMPVSTEIDPANNLIINDWGNNKLTYYSLAGKFVKEMPTGKFWSTIAFKFDSKGHIYGRNRIYGDITTEQLIKFDSNLKPTDTIASLTSKRDPSFRQAFPPRFSFNVTKDDNLIWLITSKYELSVVNGKGKTIKKIVKDHDPVKITQEIKEILIKENFGERGIPPGRTFEVPSHFPPVRYFIVDDECRIFVWTYEYEEKDGIYYLYYDVFDAEGRYIAKFLHPQEEIVFVAKKNKIYCLERESKEGIPLVKRYSLVWK